MAGRTVRLMRELDMTKRALVVGINDYSNWATPVSYGGTSWTAPSLPNCTADADSFAQVLQDGFLFDEVTTLKDGNASSSAILNGIRGVLGQSGAGDVMCFYFAGHGARIPDGSSATATRYFETIIPWDATMVSSMDIAAIADSLQPSFVNFTLVLDSCHSGGMVLSPDSRGSLWDQATAQAFQAACQTVVPWICLVDSTGLSGNVSNLQLQSSGVCAMDVDASKNNPDNAKATLLSACDFNEDAGEAPAGGHGAFTKAILDAVTACNFSISHPDFLTAVRAGVTAEGVSTQTPQLRGRPVRLQENFLASWNYSI
jgi:hypothetical protein